MITVEEAFSLIQKHMPAFLEGLSEVRADRDYPPFHRVMMDGIAVKFSDYEAGLRQFPVQGICPAGEPAKVLESGCFEVMTGAPLPVNATLVIQYEHLKLENSVARITVDAERAEWENIHLEGSDCRKGDVVLRGQAPYNGPHVGIAASMGVYFTPKHPRVMVISTGDELVERDPLPHEIRRSNAHAIEASLGHPVVKDHLKDDPKVIALHYEKNAPNFDLMIYSGGVSKGKFDYLPNVWIELGVTKYFHEVSQRPGKPLWFGVDHTRKTAVVGLPGNPVSSLVCLHRYILKNREMYACLTENVIFRKPLTNFTPVKISFSREGKMLATPLKIKNSGEFTALAMSDGFIELPKDQDHFKTGEAFRFFPWRAF